MSFIIEVLKKRENELDLCFVVRAQNGFPLSVFDNLDEAKDFIAAKVKQALESNSGDN